jgi:hypothetical protein
MAAAVEILSAFREERASRNCLLRAVSSKQRSLIGGLVESREGDR